MQSIAVEDEQGRLTLCRSAMSDVTEQKKSGAAIAQLASFPNVNPNPIFELNPSGEITYVNPAASKIFPDLAVKGINHPLCAGHSMLREMFKAGEKVAHTREIKIGNEWFEQAIYYVREGSLIRAYNQNITERKQAETDMLESRQLNELLLDSIPHPTMLIRRDRTILAANKIAREAGAAVGEFCWQSFGHSEFIPEEAKLYFKGHNRDFSSSCIKCSFCIADETKESSNPAHCEVKAFGRLWDTWWVPVKDDIYLHYAIDITERKLAEEELRKHREHLMELVEERTSELNRINITLEQEIAERKLAEAETIRAGHLAALGELAAGVAHEINNPVNGIINFAQILLNKSEPESKDREFADRIIKEGLRIATIVKNLLSFARDRKEEKRPVHVQSIMTETLALTELYLKKEGINLRVNIPSDLPEIIAHPQQIQQVVLNIISNARYALNQKFDGSHKNKTLEISGEKISVNDNAYLRMTFHDNGIGIPPDVIDKALNPFFSTKPDEKGTGLGLSISHGIITDHGGRIALESVEGEFTKVIIDLPVKK
ncbi:MAG: hypothetical protein HY758_06350 [Nitrospirae bacterium]|nr:hypothetical protein [Nitrospirota bacterium]